MTFKKKPTNAAAEIVQRQRISDLIVNKEIGKHRHVFRIHDGVIPRKHLRSPTSKLGHRGHTIILSSRSKRSNHEPRGFSCHEDSRPVLGRQEQRRIHTRRAEPRQGKATFQKNRGNHQRKHQQRGRRQRQRRRCLEFHHCQDRQQWVTALHQIRHSGSAHKELAQQPLFVCVVCVCVLFVCCCVLLCVVVCVCVLCVVCCVLLLCVHRRHHLSLPVACYHSLSLFSFFLHDHCQGCRPDSGRFPRWLSSCPACTSPAHYNNCHSSTATTQRATLLREGGWGEGKFELCEPSRWCRW